MNVGNYLRSALWDAMTKEKETQEKWHTVLRRFDDFGKICSIRKADAQIDLLLRRLEEEILFKFKIAPGGNEPAVGLQSTLSDLWVIGSYDLINSVSGIISPTEKQFPKIVELLHRLGAVRTAMSEYRGIHVGGKAPMLKMLCHETGSMMWLSAGSNLKPMNAISRRVLSDQILSIFDETPAS